MWLCRSDRVLDCCYETDLPTNHRRQATTPQTPEMEENAQDPQVRVSSRALHPPLQSFVFAPRPAPDPHVARTKRGRSTSSQPVALLSCPKTPPPNPPPADPWRSDVFLTCACCDTALLSGKVTYERCYMRVGTCSMRRTATTHCIFLILFCTACGNLVFKMQSPKFCSDRAREWTSRRCFCCCLGTVEGSAAV